MNYVLFVTYYKQHLPYIFHTHCQHNILYISTPSPPFNRNPKHPILKLPLTDPTIIQQTVSKRTQLQCGQVAFHDHPLSPEDGSFNHCNRASRRERQRQHHFRDGSASAAVGQKSHSTSDGGHFEDVEVIVGVDEGGWLFG